MCPWAGTSAAQRLQRGEKTVKSPFPVFVLTPVLSWGLALLCCLRNLDFKALSFFLSVCQELFPQTELRFQDSASQINHPHEVLRSQMVFVSTAGTQALVVLLASLFPGNPTRAGDGNPIRGKPPETYVGLGISLCNSTVGKMSRRSAGIVWGFAFSFSKPQVVLMRKTCSCHGALWKPRWKVTPCLPSSALILVCSHGALLITNTNHVLGDVLLLWKSTQGIIDPQGLCHPHVPCQWLPWAMVTLGMAFVSFWGQNLLSPREQTSRHIYEEISR